MRWGSGRWLAPALVFVLIATAIRPATARTPPPQPAPATPGPAPAAPYPPQPYAPSPLPVYPPYSGTVPGPPQMVHRERPGFLFTGLGIAGGMAIIALFGSTRSNCGDKSGTYRSDCEVHHDRFWIPVVGPLLANSGKSDPGAGDWLFAVLWAAAQTTGVVFVVVGLIGHDVPVYRPLARRGLNVIPTATPHAAGLTLRLTF